MSMRPRAVATTNTTTPHDLSSANATFSNTDVIDFRNGVAIGKSDTPDPLSSNVVDTVGTEAAPVPLTMDMIRSAVSTGVRNHMKAQSGSPSPASMGSRREDPMNSSRRGMEMKAARSEHEMNIRTRSEPTEYTNMRRSNASMRATSPDPRTMSKQQHPMRAAPNRYPMRDATSRYPMRDDPGRYPMRDAPSRYPMRDEPGRYSMRDEPGRYSMRDEPGRYSMPDEPGRFPMRSQTHARYAQERNQMRFAHERRHMRGPAADEPDFQPRAPESESQSDTTEWRVEHPAGYAHVKPGDTCHCAHHEGGACKTETTDGEVSQKRVIEQAVDAAMLKHGLTT